MATADPFAPVESGLRVIYDTVPQPKPSYRRFCYSVRQVWQELASVKAGPPPAPSDVAYSAEQLAAIERDVGQIVLPLMLQLVRERSLLLGRAAQALLWAAHHALRASKAASG